ncbi:MAG: murein tripeptide amidase MpaA [Cyanobacteria bacterium P01_H01_bin.121]
MDHLLVPQAQRGTIQHNRQIYGYSVLGAPLEVFLPYDRQINYLVLAGQHGDEPQTTTLLSSVLRSLPLESLRCAVVLAVNPDGVARGTRCNANSVDLNRNFPSRNWQAQSVVSDWWNEPIKRVELSPGQQPASEPETLALLQLVETLAPQAIISLHAALACVDDPRQTPLSVWLAAETELPLVTDIGYPTPGSFGTWAQEHDVSLITLELPDESLSGLYRRLAPVLGKLLSLPVPFSQAAQ